MSKDCHICESSCYDSDEYCESCNEFTCSECLRDDTCYECRDELECSSPFNIGDYILCTENSGFGLVSGFSCGQFTHGWPLIVGGTAVNPKFYRKYKGATSVFKGVEGGEL